MPRIQLISAQVDSKLSKSSPKDKEENFKQEKEMELIH